MTHRRSGNGGAAPSGSGFPALRPLLPPRREVWLGAALWPGGREETRPDFGDGGQGPRTPLPSQLLSLASASAQPSGAAAMRRLLGRRDPVSTRHTCPVRCSLLPAAHWGRAAPRGRRQPRSPPLTFDFAEGTDAERVAQNVVPNLHSPVLVLLFIRRRHLQPRPASAHSARPPRRRRASTEPTAPAPAPGSQRRAPAALPASPRAHRAGREGGAGRARWGAEGCGCSRWGEAAECGKVPLKRLRSRAMGWEAAAVLHPPTRR